MTQPFKIQNHQRAKRSSKAQVHNWASSGISNHETRPSVTKWRVFSLLRKKNSLAILIRKSWRLKFRKPRRLAWTRSCSSNLTPTSRRCQGSSQKSTNRKSKRPACLNIRFLEGTSRKLCRCVKDRALDLKKWSMKHNFWANSSIFKSRRTSIREIHTMRPPHKNSLTRRSKRKRRRKSPSFSKLKLPNSPMPTWRLGPTALE